MEDIKKIKKAYYNAKYRFKQTLIEEVAQQLVEGRAVDINSKYLVKNLNLKDIEKKGITIKDGLKFIKISGIEAIKYRTKQLQNFSNKKLQRDNYLQNYSNVLEVSEFTQEEKNEIMKQLKSLTPSQLSYAIKQGYVQISVMYASTLNTGEYTQNIKQRVKIVKEKFNKNKKKVEDKKVRDLAKNIIKLVK